MSDGQASRANLGGRGRLARRLALGGLALFLGCGGQTPPERATEAPQDAVFFDDFQNGQMSKWDPMEGTWALREPAPATREYGTEPRAFGLSVAGRTSWRDYTVTARVTIVDDRFGPVGLVARAQWSHHYFELLLGRSPEGQKTWSIRQRRQHAWTTLASGAFDYALGHAYVLRFGLRGSELEAAVSVDDGQSFARLGTASTPPDAWGNGRIGLVSYGGDARFDDVSVVGGDILFGHLGPWGHIALLRDTSGRFPGGPTGGWYVTPIHATLRASDGKVLITGFGRRAPDNCSGTTQREVGETWLLDPAQIDGLVGGTLFVNPIDEQNLDPTHEVLYCAGHNTLSDGRIFFSAGTDFPNQLPDSSPERGLTYSRIYNPATGNMTRIAANMSGGQSITRGEKWYPTNLLMPDGRVLMFGGFHWSSGGPGSKPNLSLEMFDPKIWDANPAANPYQVLTQHEEGQADTPPTRGYTNLFLLPKPVPAGSAGGWARSVALAGGVGRVFLFNHEPGPTGAARLHARTNALTPNPSSTEKGEGSSGLVLPDGTLMFANGGHTGTGAANAYFYNPYSDSWSSLATGISRMYGDAVQLPDGNVLLVNGYVSEPGNVGDVSSPLGNIRQPTLVDPFARTSSNLPAWPEATHRGYHSLAVLLKDGRVLIGGGKDADHATGCEKNELRIFSPPNLSAGPRPVVNAPQEGTAITVAGSPFTVAYTGTVRATRGVVLMAPGSITHSFDSGQRYVPLSYTVSGTGTLTVEPPANINIAQPGDYLLFVVSNEGAPSVGVHVRLQAPPPRSYTIAGDTYLESECSSRRSGPWDLVSDPAVSGGQYLAVRQSSGNHTTVPDEGKVMWYDLDVTSGGSFNLWLRGQGVTTSDDSFWVSIDGGADRQVTPPAAFGWVKAGTTTFSIPTGKHQLKIKVREDGSRVDKIFLTKTTATPSGLGGTAQIQCGGPTCTDPAAPSNLVVTPGACSASLTWTDNSNNETGFRIERNGTLLPVLAANQTSFVDQPLAAGSYTYRIQSLSGTCSSAFVSAPAVTVSCTPVGTSISNLVVNDTTTGNNGVANNTEWSIQGNFDGGAGQLAFGDRSYTISALPAAAAHLRGKPWIRTAADSKTYAATSPPLATATVTGSFVYLAVDSRHATTFLTSNGFASQGYALTVMEGTTARSYNVWRKAITSGSTVSFPSIGATTAPCYFIVAE